MRPPPQPLIAGCKKLNSGTGECTNTGCDNSPQQQCTQVCNMAQTGYASCRLEVTIVDAKCENSASSCTATASCSGDLKGRVQLEYKDCPPENDPNTTFWPREVTLCQAWYNCNTDAIISTVQCDLIPIWGTVYNPNTFDNPYLAPAFIRTKPACVSSQYQVKTYDNGGVAASCSNTGNQPGNCSVAIGICTNGAAKAVSCCVPQ